MNARFIKRPNKNKFKRPNPFYRRKLRRRNMPIPKDKPVSKFAIRREKRLNLSKPRFSYRFTRSRPNQPTNGRINKRIDQLGKQLEKLTLNEPTNLIKGKQKEPRTDKLTTPMQMALTSSYVSMFPTSNKIFYTNVYTKLSFTTAYDKRSILWFPYAVGFKDLGKEINVSGHNADRVANCSSIGYQYFHVFDCGTCNITGSYRVVGATMKIYNVTPMVSRGGDFTIYKLNDTEVNPFVYYHEYNITAETLPDAYGPYYNYADMNYDQVTVKNNFSATDKCVYINEYNVNEGTNIFNQAYEYLGNGYSPTDEENFAVPHPNVIGSNVKYLLKFPGLAQQQTYTIEFWQVIEFVPLPSLNLSNMCYNVTHVYPPNIIQDICQLNPLSKV